MTWNSVQTWVTKMAKSPQHVGCSDLFTGSHEPFA